MSITRKILITLSGNEVTGLLSSVLSEGEQSSLQTVKPMISEMADSINENPEWGSN